jgi:ubiquinone/menaquinone biosynthesis C-methylase UbiE
MGGIMFLRERTTQAEYFDSLRPRAELESFYRSLERVNRFFVNGEVFQRMIPRLLSPETCRQLRVLDLGAGDGALGRELSTWARNRGWEWTVTSLDFNPTALELGAGERVAGSVIDLPFLDESFDVVIASQMTHHLRCEQIPRHFAESWRVASKGVLICDLHRNAVLYTALFVTLHLQRHSKDFIEDALLSVHRGWRVAELRELTKTSGISQLKVHLYYGARVLVIGRKSD